MLAEWFRSQDASFNQERWTDYIMGECGQGGELTLAECEKTLAAGTAVENKIVPKSGLAALDRSKIASFKPR